MTGRRERPQQHLAGCEAAIFTKRERVFTERAGHTALPFPGQSNHPRQGQRAAASFARPRPIQTSPGVSCAPVVMPEQRTASWLREPQGLSD